MRRITKFKIVFNSIIWAIIAAIFYSYVAYDFIELDKAVQITMTRFAIPLLLSCSIISVIIYNRFIKQLEKKWYNSKILNFGKIIFRIIILSGALSILGLGGTLSTLIISNDLLNKNESFVFRGTVIKAWETKSMKHADKSYIKVKAENSDQMIELKVPHLYQAGSSFSKEMKLGYWGLLYSKT